MLSSLNSLSAIEITNFIFFESRNLISFQRSHTIIKLDSFFGSGRYSMAIRTFLKVAFHLPPPPHGNLRKSRLETSTAWIHSSSKPVGLICSLPTISSKIRCMANPRRVKMVAKQIRRELSDMLLTDKVLQYAILPEYSLGADRYLSSLTTISDVEVSTDLQVVKVYVSVFGDERGKDIAMAGLKSKAKYVRSELGKRMKLRLTPEVRFIEDESLERGSRVIAILDKLKEEKKAIGSEGVELFEASDIPQDERDWEDDEPDEDVIYIK